MYFLLNILKAIFPFLINKTKGCKEKVKGNTWKKTLILTIVKFYVIIITGRLWFEYRKGYDSIRDIFVFDCKNRIGITNSKLSELIVKFELISRTVRDV